MPRLTPRARKAVLVTHVAVSVGALGVYLALLTLAVVALGGADPEVLRTAYGAMGLVADVLLLPVSLAILGTGLLLALGTRWSLRHVWVATKLGLTIGISAASIFGLRSRIADVLGGLPAVDDGAAVLLVVLVPVAIAVYLGATVLSIYKPWARIAQPARPVAVR